MVLQYHSMLAQLVVEMSISRDVGVVHFCEGSIQ